MAKTEPELLKMSFMEIKKHCKALDIPITFGATKGSMIKLILAKDPPPKTQESENDSASKLEHRLQKQLSLSARDDLLRYDESAYKRNTISLKDAQDILKRYFPQSGTGVTMYPAFRSLFRPTRFEQLSVAQFTNAVITGNIDILSRGILDDIILHLCAWDDPNNANAYSIALQRLNGFHAPPDSGHNDRLMFAMFQIDNLLPKIRVVQKLHTVRDQLLEVLLVMTKLQQCLAQIVGNEVYSRILLSSILLSKFRNEDIKVPIHAVAELNGRDNVIYFMQTVALQPTAKEIFHSKRWDKLKEKGTLEQEINRPQMLLSDDEFNKIRAKAIQFGSAVAPQPARIARPVVDKKTKQQQIKKEIGAIDKKALQSKLQMALKNKLGAPGAASSASPNQSQEDVKNESDENDDLENDENNKNDEQNEEKTAAAPSDDLSKFRKMLTLGVKFDAVVHAMQVAGIAEDVVQEFVHDVNNAKTDTDSSVSRPAVQPRMHNALLADINRNRNVAPASAPVPVPVPAPIPMAAPVPMPPQPTRFISGANRVAAASSSSAIPKQHDNVGLSWTSLEKQIIWLKAQIPQLRVLIHAADIRLFRRRQEQEQKQDDNVQNNNDDDVNDDDVRMHDEFHDPIFEVYIAQLNRLQSGVNDAVKKNNACKALLNQLDVDYHRKFRPMILKNITKSNYNALKAAANNYGDDVFVPDDIVGTIWSFVKPFDDLVELKFAVDCINEYFDKEKKKIARKKLPIQSHRGYEYC